MDMFIYNKLIQQIRERELAESIASSSEEYLRQVGDWSPGESSDTTKSSSR